MASRSDGGDKGPGPAKGAQVPVVAPPFHDLETIDTLVAGARRLGPREELIVLLGADAGLRKGEIAGLVHADLTLGSRNVIHLRRALWQGHEEAPKGGRDRMVPMTPRLRDALMRMPKTPRGRGTAGVLTRDDGQDVSAKWIIAAIKRAEREAGMRMTGWCRILRHSFCSALVIAGKHPRVIQKLAGHANLSTTLGYMHLPPDAGDDAIAALGSLAGAAERDRASEK